MTYGAESIDISRPPNYSQLGTVTGSEKLSALRDSLGDALAVSWRGAASGRSGSCSLETFASWVDLYQWVDLFESDQSVVMKQWLARHLEIAEESNNGGHSFHVTMLQPGCTLGHPPVRPALIDKVMADNSLLTQITAKLVAQPFSPGSGNISDQLDPNFIAATLSDPVFLQRWSENFSKDDVALKVLLNLQEIWKAHPADWHEFQSLALAVAVVNDQPAPEGWPHHQVSPSAVPREMRSPKELFSEWVTAFRDGKLRMDPRLLGAGELKFVVDAPLKLSEFLTIRDNPALSHLDIQKAFESIAYDQGRVIKNVYDWPWGEYLLSSIKEHGGICVDQAYYAAIAGKALGIPTIFFSGQGRDGGHAWVGYLKGSEHWDFNVGRYASQNYATGEGLDPQSWAPITDHDLELLTRHLGNHDFQNAARRDLVMAQVFRRKGDLAAEGVALESALQVAPENPVFWDAREEWLVRSGAPQADIKAHHQAAISQFSRFNDLKAQHQQALINLALRSGDKQDAQEISEQIVHENRGGWSREARSDISAQAAWSMIMERLKVNDFNNAVGEFERQLHLLGENGGGDFFYMVVAPLASQLIRTGHQDLALKILKEAYLTLKPAHDSILDHDLRKMWAAAGGAPSTPAVMPRY